MDSSPSSFEFGDNWYCVSSATTPILTSSRRGKRPRITRFRSSVPGPDPEASAEGAGGHRWLRSPRSAALFLRDISLCALGQALRCFRGVHDANRVDLPRPRRWWMAAKPSDGSSTSASRSQRCCRRSAASRRSWRGPPQVPLHRDLEGHVENHRHRRSAMPPSDLEQLAPRPALDVRGVDHGSASAAEPHGEQLVQQVERVVGGGLGVRVIGDHRPHGVRGEDLRRGEVSGRRTWSCRWPPRRSAGRGHRSGVGGRQTGRRGHRRPAKMP